MQATRRTQRRFRRGQVMVIAVLALLLLTGLLFAIINVGHNVTRRLNAQGGADSAAISGGVHMARSLNTVSMNNISMARLLSLVPIMDSLPLATQMSTEELLAWQEHLEWQLDQPLPADRIREPMLEGLDKLRERFEYQYQLLEPTASLLNGGGVDISEKTFYRIRGRSDVPPHGDFWRAARHLDQFNQATAAVAGIGAQRAAREHAEQSNTPASLLLPLTPAFPAEHGDWRDWYRNRGQRDTVLEHGRTPQHDEPHRLGGFDKHFNWRDMVYRNIYGPPEYRPGTGGQRRGVRGPRAGGKTVGNSGVGSGHPGGLHRPVIGRELIGYRTYGPWEWMRRRVNDYWWRHLRDSNFNEQFNTLARAKLEYMFQSSVEQQIHYPQWRTYYPDAVSLAQGGARITYTMFYKITIRSRYPQDDSQFMSPGSYASNADSPMTIRANGWVDPATWGVQQIADYIWEDPWEYETTQDLEIGIVQPPKSDPTDPDEWFPVYMIDRYVFAGVDIGGEWPIRNPANFDSLDDLPAPMLMDLSGGDYDVSDPDHDHGVRRQLYTLLGVGHVYDNPFGWQGRFATGHPAGGVTALAQVEIYNNTSWGLFCQDWHAQLVPVTGSAQWLRALENGAYLLSTTPEVNMTLEEYDRIQNSLDAYEGEFLDSMLQH